MKKFFLVQAIKVVFFVIAIGTLVGFILMSLWNWLIPALFAGPIISFWQAIGLLVLSKILFSGFGGHRGGPGRHRGFWKQKMEEKMRKMSPEEREKIREKFRKCGPWGRTDFRDENENKTNDGTQQ